VDAYFDAYYAASQAAFQRIFHTLQLAPPDEAARQRERQNYLNPEQKNFAFFNNDELVGGALIVDGYLLDDVFVAPRWHGCGFGTQIVHYVTNRILEQSPRAELAVLTDNTGAERLYRRLGYQRVKTMEIMRTPLGAAF
jgi:predicted GNAT family acetyltransferase